MSSSQAAMYDREPDDDRRPQNSEWALEAVCARAADYGLSEAETSLLIGLEIIKATFISVGAEAAERSTTAPFLWFWQMISQSAGALTQIPVAHHLTPGRLERFSEQQIASIGRAMRGPKDFRDPDFQPHAQERKLVGFVAGVEARATLDTLRECLKQQNADPSRALRGLKEFISQSPQFDNLFTVHGKSFREAGYLQHAVTLLDALEAPQAAQPLSDQLHNAVEKLSKIALALPNPVKQPLVNLAQKNWKLIIHHPDEALRRSVLATERTLNQASTEQIQR